MGDDGAEGYAREAHRRQRTVTEAQADGQQDIHSVHQEVGHHGADGILHADEPALERKEGKSSRSRPDTDVEVAGGQFADFRAAVHRQKNQQQDCPLQHNEQETRSKSRLQAPAKNPAQLGIVSVGRVGQMSAVSLRSEPSGTGTEEAETPVQQVEKHSPDRDAADQGRGRISIRTSQMPCHGQIHHSHQGNGEAGQDTGNGQPQDFAVEFHRNFLSSSSIPR